MIKGKEYGKILIAEQLEPTPVRVVYRNHTVSKPRELHHTQDQHDTWVERGVRCPYCLVGSIIRSREEINRMIP